MNDNTSLSDMIREDTPATPVFQEANLDLPPETEPVEAPEAPVEELPTVEELAIAPLNLWFEANSSSFDNINQVNVAIRGVDSSKTLIMAVLDGIGEVEGNPSRDLQVFKNADVQPVLAMPASDMQIFNNGFKLVYPYDDVLIKCYGVRTGLICVFCNVINDLPVPYQVVKVKKKDETVEVVRRPVNEVIAKMPLAADLEALQLLYKQSSKAVEELSTVESVVAWLLEKQSEITDINHLLQIDNVLISILA